MQKPMKWLLMIVLPIAFIGIGCGIVPPPGQADLDPFLGIGPFGPFGGYILDEEGNRVDPQGDEDGDGVINADDECIGVPGPAQNAGCPLDDSADEDGDGVPNGADGCPFTAGPPQSSGCPLAPEADFDGDGVANGDDDCPFESGTGADGCPEDEPDPTSDADGDGIPDELDACPLQHGHGSPSGCPVIDSDGDGIPDELDACPLQHGQGSPSGCPVIDSDGDGIPDELDACPLQHGHGSPSGCPVIDSDGDGVPDSADGCPNDPNKVSPGICGCGVSDADSDGDGVVDCQDDCPDEFGNGPNGCPLQSDLQVDAAGVQYGIDALAEGWSILTNLDAVLVRNPDTGVWTRLDDLTLKYVSSVWMIEGVKQYWGVCKYPGASAPDGCICGDGGCESFTAQGDMRVFRWLLEEYAYEPSETLSWWVRFEVEEFDGTAEVCVEFNEPLPGL